MFEREVTISEGQSLTLVKMRHNATIRSWEKPGILLRLREGVENNLQIEESDSGIAVSCEEDCEIWVPADIPVKVRSALANLKVSGLKEIEVEQVRGNLKVAELEQAVLAEVYGSLHATSIASLRLAGSVYGNARLKGVGTGDLQNLRGNLSAKELEGLRVSRIGGNLYAKAIKGPLTAEQVGGNARLQDVAGPVAIDQVAGNLSAKDLAGGAKIPKVGGNVVLSGTLGKGRTYQLSARGNAVLRLPEEASAHLTLTAQGQLVGPASLVDERREGNTLVGTVGDGGTEIVIEARGNVMVGGSDPGIEVDLGEEITRQLEESLEAIDLEAISRHASEEMEAAMSRLQIKLESVDWGRIGVQAQQAAERAMDQMRRNMDRMTAQAARQQERLERRLEREKGRLERVERRHRRTHAPNHAIDIEIREGRSGVDGDHELMDPLANLDEERLSILRMVEQGQITPEEAEMLLEALQHS